MRRRKRETTNANAVHGNAFVNGVFGYLQGIDETPFYIRILVGQSRFENYSYYLVRLLQILILGVDEFSLTDYHWLEIMYLYF